MARLTNSELLKLEAHPEGFKKLSEEQRRDERLVRHALGKVPGIFPYLEVFFRDSDELVLDFMLDKVGGHHRRGSKYFGAVSDRLRGDMDFLERVMSGNPSAIDDVLPHLPSDKMVSKPGVLQLALLSQGKVYQYLSGDLVSDPDVLRVCLTCSPDMLKHTPVEVQRSRNWILHCVRLSAESIRNMEGKSKALPAVRSLLEDVDFAQELIQVNPNVYRYLAGRPRSNSVIISNAIGANGLLYSSLPDAEQNSGKWAGAAFRAGLDFLPEILADREECIDDFLGVHPECVQEVPAEHVRAEEWMKKCHQRTNGRCWFGKGEQEILGDAEFVLELLSDAVGSLWGVLPKRLKTNSGFVLRAVQANPEVYPWLTEKFRAQKRVFAALGLSRGLFVQFAPKKLLKETNVMREVAEQSPSCLQYLDVEVIRAIVDAAGAGFVESSIRAHGNNLSFFWDRLDSLNLDKTEMLRLALEEGGGDWLPEDCEDGSYARKAVLNWSSRTPEKARLRFGRRHLSGPPIVNWYHHGLSGTMTTFRDRFCQDKDFVLFLIEQVVHAWERRGGGRKSSRRFGLFKFDEPGSWFTESGLLSLWGEDADVVRLAIENAPDCLRGLDVNLLRELDFTASLLQKDLSLFKALPDELLQDLTWVRSIVARLGSQVVSYDFETSVFVLDPNQELKGVLAFRKG